MKDVSFIRNQNFILDNFNWQMKQNERWAILGPNGAGKSTLISMITAEQWASKGSVSIMGEDYGGGVNILDIKKRIGLFQPAINEATAHYHPSLTALDMICTGYDAALAVYRNYPSEVVRKAEELLNSTLTDGHESISPEHLFQNLSSGEKRRVLLLRTLIASPELLILDEPYESLDIPARFELEKLIVDQVQKYQTPVIMILHRTEEIPEFVTHLLLIQNGKIVAAGTRSQVLTQELFSKLYGLPLLLKEWNGRIFAIPKNR